VPAVMPTKPRPIGGVSGIVLPPSFFDPLPDDLLDAFEGKSQRRVSRVAERPPAYHVPPPPRKRHR